MKTFAIRLTPGQDIRAALVQFSADQGLQAACVLSAVGSVSRANIRYGGQDHGTLTAGSLEIVVLVGTLSPDGPHLHIAVADERGGVVAGHMLDGCIVRTTAEIVVGEMEGIRFRRCRDNETGYRELVIEENDVDFQE